MRTEINIVLEADTVYKGLIQEKGRDCILSELAIWNYSDPYEYIRKVQRNEMPPLIVTCAITDSGAGKEINPNLPEPQSHQKFTALQGYLRTVGNDAEMDFGQSERQVGRLCTPSLFLESGRCDGIA